MSSRKKIKFSAVIVGILVGFVIFLGTVFLETKINGESKMKSAIVAKVSVPSGTSITNENVGQYFKSSKIDPSMIVENCATDLKQITNKMVRSDIVKNGVVSMNNFADSKMDLNLLKEPVEVSLNFSNMGSVVGGTLRSGDIVNVIAINKSNGQLDGSLSNVYVNKVLNSDGVMLGREDPGTGLNVNLIINKADEDFISSHLLTSEFRIVKVK